MTRTVPRPDNRLQLQPLPAVAATIDPRLVSGNSAWTANSIRAARAIMPRSGSLTDLTIYVGTSASAIEVSVYDVAGATRTRLYTTGSLACPAAGAYAIVATAGQMNLAFNAGDQFDLALGADNATALFGRYTPVANMAKLPASFAPAQNGAALPQMSWSVATLPAPTYMPEANMIVNVSITPFLMARVI